ncbi:hypothetical protein RRG08_005697 [Elysia crispata]|uniref:Uncharacterized protein n=1 Tax=Elysia crispata TaxID=231223 RepID=A0AAE0YCL8_9GAST|nr:hypothetical protein RRG08_005697 [Elysia crispata]
MTASTSREASMDTGEHVKRGLALLECRRDKEDDSPVYPYLFSNLSDVGLALHVCSSQLMLKDLAGFGRWLGQPYLMPHVYVLDRVREKISIVVRGVQAWGTERLRRTCLQSLGSQRSNGRGRHPEPIQTSNKSQNRGAICTSAYTSFRHRVNSWQNQQASQSG